MAELPPKPDTTSNTHQQAGNGLALGMSMLANVFVAMAMGYGLDVWLGTKPLFLLLFIFLGFAAGMRGIWKQMQQKK